VQYENVQKLISIIGSTHTTTPEGFVKDLKALGRGGIAGNPPNPLPQHPQAPGRPARSPGRPTTYQKCVGDAYLPLSPDSNADLSVVSSIVAIGYLQLDLLNSLHRLHQSSSNSSYNNNHNCSILIHSLVLSRIG
jgi:hypothetical protein